MITTDLRACVREMIDRGRTNDKVPPREGFDNLHLSTVLLRRHCEFRGLSYDD